MIWFNWGNPPIASSATAQPVSNPSTSTLINEIDSTQLGTVNFVGAQTRKYQVTWIVGADTNATWQLEQANSTALGASTTTIFVKTPTAQSGQYVTYHELGVNDRLRARVNSTFTGNATAFILAVALT